MTRVVFYTGVSDIAAFLCRFLHQRVFMPLPHKTALIYSSSGNLARLDEQLWGSQYFLPHAVLPPAAPGQVASPDIVAAEKEEAPIILTSAEPPHAHASDMLILQSAEVPGFAGSYPVCIDIVGATEDSKRAGRKRYRYFQDNGYQLEVINMDEAGGKRR